MLKLIYLLFFITNFNADSLLNTKATIKDNYLKLSFQEKLSGKLKVDYFLKQNSKTFNSESFFLKETSELFLSPETTIIDLNSLNLEFSQWDYQFYKRFSLFGSGRGQFRAGVSINKDEFDGIFITDQASDQILKYSQEMELLKVIGGFNFDRTSAFTKDRYSLEKTGFDEPFELISSSKLSYYVSDSRNKRVVEVDLEGNFLRELNSRSKFDEPSSLAINSKFDLYVLDSRKDTIYIFNAMRNPTFKIGGYGKSKDRFNKPKDFLILENDEVLVLDSGNNSLKAFATNARFLKEMPIDNGQNKLCLDSFNVIYSLGEKLLSYTNDLEPWESEFKNKPKDFKPKDCTALSNGHLYFLEQKSRVSIFIPKVSLDKKTIKLQ